MGGVSLTEVDNRVVMESEEQDQTACSFRLNVAVYSNPQISQRSDTEG